MNKEFDVNDKALLFYNDRLPVVVKRDGETVKNLSAQNKSVTGTDTINYTSEYNKSLRDFQIGGNTTQQSYEGYNLLNKDTFSQIELRKETPIKIHASSVLSNAYVNAMLKPNTTYRMSYEVEGIEGMPDGATVYSATMFMLYSSSSSGILIAKGGIPKTSEVWQVSKTFTTPANFYEGDYSLRCYSGYYNLDGVSTTATCIFRNVQIVEGTEEKPYEPYVGGTYSPNPGKQVEYTSQMYAGSGNSTENIANGMLISSNYVYLPDHCTDMYFYSSVNSTVPSDVMMGIYTDENGFDTIYENGEVKEVHLITDKVKLFISSPNLTSANASTYWGYYTSSKTSFFVTYKRCHDSYPQPIENANYRTLPDEYQQVEYIESTGTQAINTEIKPTRYSKLDITAQLTKDYTNTSANAVSGTSKNYSRLSFGYVPGTSKTNFALLVAGFNYDSGFPLDMETHVFKLQYGDCYIDDYHWSFPYSSKILGEEPLYIFAIPTSGVENVPRLFINMRIYSWKMYDGGATLRDYVPCYRKSDGKIGLYDLVGKKFYTNIGTGTFLKGANVQSEKMSVVLHGENLYDISKVNGAANLSTATPNVAGNSTLGTITDGVLHLSTSIYSQSTLWTGCTIPIEKGGDYYFSADLFINSSIITPNSRINVSFRNFTKKTSLTLSYLFYEERDTWSRKTFSKLTVPDTWIGDDVYLILQASGSAEQYFNLPIYAKNIMISYENPKPYEPCFREEITIPASVNGIPLRFAGSDILINNIQFKDKLIVDTTMNKVLYVQAFQTLELTGDIAPYNSYETPNGMYLSFKLDAPIPFNSIGIAKCNYAQQDLHIAMINYNYFDVWDGGDSTKVDLHILGYSTKEEAITMIKQKHSEGNPYLFQYPLAEPIEHDISESELGIHLLDLLNKVRYGTVYLDVGSNLSVPISVTYASWGGKDE